ncbi:hypothetical protein Tco_1547630 [Tanacetum coccineum]
MRGYESYLANEPLRTKEALGSDVGHMYMLEHEVEKLHDEIKVTNDKDCSLMIGVFSFEEDSDELEYPQELFLGTWSGDLSFEEEDGEWICFLGGSSSSRTKKYRGSNSNDGGNIGDGVKIADENTGGIILSVEFSEELKELLPDEAGK